MSQHVPTLQFKQLKTGERVYFSLVQKQSQNKVLFNQRLLILVEQRYIGYTKEYNKKDLSNSMDLSKLKKKIPLNDIRRILNINKQVTIMINQYDKLNKLKSTKWLFRMDNEKLAEDWTSVLERQNSPSPSRKTTEHNRQHDQKSLGNQNNPSVKSLFNKQTNQNLKKEESKGRLNNTVSQKLLLQRQKSKQKQLKILKYIQTQQQKQKLEREKQRLKQMQIEKQKEKQRIKEIQTQNQKQKQTQKRQSKEIKRPDTIHSKNYPTQIHQIDQKKRENFTNDIRFSDRTFTFKQNLQQQNYSPPKRQARVNYPNSNTNSIGHMSLAQKDKIFDEKLSLRLQQGVNRRLVQNELILNKNKIHKYSEYQFKQLGQVLTNRQKQLENKNFINYFKETFYLINDHRFQDFYSLIEMKIQQLLMQDLQNRQALQQWVQFIENKNGVNIKVILTQLKQIPGNTNICDEGLLKSYLTKAKNMDYIWRIISQDKALSQIFLMPMTCVAQFQGMVAFFTCLCDPETDSVQRPQDYSEYFELLCQKTKISRSIIQNPSCIKFIKHGNKFIISEINELLPKITSINSTIRPQMFMQISEQLPAIQVQYKKNKQNSFNNSRLVKKQQEQQNKYFKQPITQAIKVISGNLDKLQEYVVHPSEFSHLMHLYGLNIVYIHQIYEQIQNNYIKNILKTEIALRSFKVIYRKRIQHMLMSPQKKRKKLENIYIDLQSQQMQGKNKQNSEKRSYLQKLHQTTKGLINIFLSNMEESNQLWNNVTLHSQINFKLSVDKAQINKGYLFLGLQHHLGLKYSTIYSTCEKIFTVENFINQLQFVAKIKPCQLYWIDDSIYNLPLNQVADTLLLELELDKKQIPFYIYQNKNILDKIYEILSLYHSPNSEKIKHLHIFKDCHQNSEKTLFYFRRKLSEIKWFIKGESYQLNSLSSILQPIQYKLLALKESLIFYFGNYHPFYTQIYDILISIHERGNQYQKAEQYSKLAMSNMIQLCGGNTMHIKLANNYYQKGQLYQNWGKIQQAIANYKKSKNILEYNQYLNSKQYAMVQLRLSVLYLNKFKDNDSFRLLFHCLQIFCRICKIQLKNSNMITQPNMKNIENSRVNTKTNIKVSKQEQILPQISSYEQLQLYSHISICLQLMNRCVTAQSLDRTSILIKQTHSILVSCLDPHEPMVQVQFPDQLTAKLLKIMVQNYFIQHKRQINQQFLTLIQLICDNLHDGKIYQNNDFNGSIDVLKSFIINGVLMENLDGFSSKAKLLIEQISLSKKAFSKNTKNVKNKDIQKFQMLMKALIVVVGQAFIFGILNDKNM